MPSSELPSPETETVVHRGEQFDASDSAATNIADYAEQVVAAAPPPDPEKVQRIVALLLSGGGVR